MSIYAKLSKIQNELKAPKGQKNKFGNYNYRSCEDILEAVKPLCFKNLATLVINDTIELIGDRYYIKATATLYDIETTEIISNNAYAREELTKKGMDGSQITGTASSYARKYALNGLFNIDDTKDADTDEYAKKTSYTPKPKKDYQTKNSNESIGIQMSDKLKDLRQQVLDLISVKGLDINAVKNEFGLTKDSGLSVYSKTLAELKKR